MDPGNRGRRKRRPWLRIGIALLLLAVMMLSVWQLLGIYDGYVAEELLHQSVQTLRASEGTATQTAPETAETGDESSLISLQNVYPDVVGWISLANTFVDYPIAQADDNSAYLRRDLSGEYALAGSIFMDYRNSSEEPGWHTIVYGHNMKNDSMFGQLNRYLDTDFFHANRYGELLLGEKSYRLEAVACLRVNANDEFFYSARLDTEEDRAKMLEFLRKNALQRAMEELSEGDRLLTLSTCTDFGDTERLALVLRVVEE